MEAILKREIVLSKRIYGVCCVFIFVAFTALGAFVRIPLPFTPVPITLQTLFVLLSGALLGSSLGLTAQLSYIFLGVLGLPIFSGAGSGLIYLFGPTGGYLVGFVLASLWIGRTVRQTERGFWLTFVVFCLADLIILFCGLIWLKLFFRYSFSKLLFIGFIPFIITDILKVFTACGIYLKLKHRFQAIL
ncbi:MAG: biotin transporter BioY [Candidatus Omnitrophica bacterium]|nr:biotin transporter BioY [Candidatus Omnitrophota bacterium]